jgi:tight adherence protein B
VSSWLPVLLAAVGGAALVVAVREALRSFPLLAAEVESALSVLTRAGRDGSDPSSDERRRLGYLAGAVLGGLALLLAGPGPVALVAIAGPVLAGWLLERRRARYRAAVEADVATIATAMADALATGTSLRNALVDVALSLEGPSRAELARVRADLELGLPARAALGALGERIGSEPVAALCRAAISQERTGGDLADLLRRHARAASARQRAEQDARAATAQARLTGGMVVAMPVCVGLAVEAVAPGFLGRMLGDPLATVVLVVAGMLQLAGYVAIRRLSRVS